MVTKSQKANSVKANHTTFPVVLRDEKDGYILTEEGQQAIRELQSLDNKATVGAKE